MAGSAGVASVPKSGSVPDEGIGDRDRSQRLKAQVLHHHLETEGRGPIARDRGRGSQGFRDADPGLGDDAEVVIRGIRPDGEVYGRDGLGSRCRAACSSGLGRTVREVVFHNGVPDDLIRTLGEVGEQVGSVIPGLNAATDRLSVEGCSRESDGDPADTGIGTVPLGIVVEVAVDFPGNARCENVDGTGRRIVGRAQIERSRADRKGVRKRISGTSGDDLYGNGDPDVRRGGNRAERAGERRISNNTRTSRIARRAGCLGDGRLSGQNHAGRKRVGENDLFRFGETGSLSHGHSELEGEVLVEIHLVIRNRCLRDGAKIGSGPDRRVLLGSVVRLTQIEIIRGIERIDLVTVD